MKTISLKGAYEILERYTTAVVIDDSVLVYPRLSELKDSEDNEFLYLSCVSSQVGKIILGYAQ